MIPQLGPIQIIAWIPETSARGSLEGYFDVQWGPLVIRRLTLYNAAGGHKTGFPQRRAGSGEWVNTFGFLSPRDAREFLHAAQQALFSFFEEQSEPKSAQEATCGA